MKKLGAVVCLLLLASACGGTSETSETPTTTVPTTTVPTTTVPTTTVPTTTVPTTTVPTTTIAVPTTTTAFIASKALDESVLDADWEEIGLRVLKGSVIDSEELNILGGFMDERTPESALRIAIRWISEDREQCTVLTKGLTRSIRVDGTGQCLFYVQMHETAIVNGSTSDQQVVTPATTKMVMIDNGLVSVAQTNFLLDHPTQPEQRTIITATPDCPVFRKAVFPEVSFEDEERIADVLIDIDIGRTIDKGTFGCGDTYFSELGSGWSPALFVAGDEGACEITNTGGPRLKGLGSGTCIVGIKATEVIGFDHFPEFGESIIRFFQINVGLPTDTTSNQKIAFNQQSSLEKFGPISVTTTTPPTTTTTIAEWEFSTKYGSKDCIEGFVVRDKPQQNQPESLLQYEITAVEDDTESYLHVLECDQLEDMKSDPANNRSHTRLPKIEISIESERTGSEVLLINWLDRSGVETRFRSVSNLDQRSTIGHPTVFETWMGDVFVVRVEDFRPEVTYLEDCSSHELLESWSLESHQLAGWTVNVDCLIPEGLRNLWVEEFEKDLTYVAEIMPSTAVPKLKTAKFWILSPINFKARGADYAVGISPGTPQEIRGHIRLAAGNGPPSIMHFPEERRAAYALHELAHFWDYNVYPGDQRVNGVCQAKMWKETEVQLSGDPGLVNCRHETPVTEAYFAAREAQIYEEVETIWDSTTESYALKNHDEYFGVLTQSYFWTSGFYPFDREQLLEHDPVGAAAVEAAWNLIPDMDCLMAGTNDCK